jgi:hypothetical protein
MTSKSMILASLLMVSLALISGISAVGLLQSSERIGSSGIVVKPAPSPTPPQPPLPPPPEPTIKIDIYRDFECTEVMTNVDWGSIEAGGSVSRVIYIKNSGDSGVRLSLVADNWNPSAAAGYLTLSWSYDGDALSPGAVVGVTLTLAVSSSIVGVDSFSFDIVIVGSAS